MGSEKLEVVGEMEKEGKADGGKDDGAVDADKAFVPLREEFKFLNDIRIVLMS